MQRELFKNSLRLLVHISKRNLLKAFYLWVCNLNKSRSRIQKLPEKHLKDLKHENSNKSIKGSSPVSPGHRLFQKAQEIELRKSETRKSMVTEYSFTPQLSNSTKKWLDSKAKKETKCQIEEIAVVSGSKGFNFEIFKEKIKKNHESKIPGLDQNSNKERIICERKEGRSNPSFSPSKIPRQNSLTSYFSKH
jgi:hypothetical protein